MTELYRLNLWGQAWDPNMDHYTEPLDVSAAAGKDLLLEFSAYSGEWKVTVQRCDEPDIWSAQAEVSGGGGRFSSLLPKSQSQLPLRLLLRPSASFAGHEMVLYSVP
jgi:hypothetical protein